MGSVNEEVVFFKSNNRCFTTSVITLGGLSISVKQLSRFLSFAGGKREKSNRGVFSRHSLAFVVNEKRIETMHALLSIVLPW